MMDKMTVYKLIQKLSKYDADIYVSFNLNIIENEIIDFDGFLSFKDIYADTDNDIIINLEC